MEIGFQIGKELGELRSRVDLIESRLTSRGCGCRDKVRGRALMPSEITPLQRDVLKVLNEAQRDVLTAVNKVIKSALKAKGHSVSLEVVGLKLQDVANIPIDRRSAGCPWICCDGNYYCCPADTCCEERTSSGPLD